MKNQGSATLTLQSASGSQLYTTAAAATATVAADSILRLISDGTYWNQVD